MKTQGLEVLQDVTYTSLIEVLCKGEKLEEAMDHLKDKKCSKILAKWDFMPTVDLSIVDPVSNINIVVFNLTLMSC